MPPPAACPCSQSFSTIRPTRRSKKMRFVESLGFTGAEIMNPSVQLKTDDDVVDYFDFVAPATGLALVLYRTPVSGFVYSHDAVARIAEHANVVGIKNGTLSWTDSIALRHRFGGDHLVISEPNERYWAHDAALFGGRVLYGGALPDPLRETAAGTAPIHRPCVCW